MACWILRHPDLLKVFRQDLLGAGPGLGFFGWLEGGGHDVFLQVVRVCQRLLVVFAQFGEGGDGLLLKLVEDDGPLFEVLGELPGEAFFEVVPLGEQGVRL